jgi:hypothetical protein
MFRFLAPKRAGIDVIILFTLIAWATPALSATNALSPGTYRCSSYNVSGGGGSCRYMRPFVLGPDGSYTYGSSRGRGRTIGHTLLLSNSRLWGPGEILHQRTIRFTYAYRGWRHTVTWRCQDCESAAGGGAEAADGTRRGVSLMLEFRQSIGGVSDYTIVPAENARTYSQNAALPEGALQGLAWASGANTNIDVKSKYYERPLSYGWDSIYIFRV